MANIKETTDECQGKEVFVFFLGGTGDNSDRTMNTRNNLYQRATGSSRMSLLASVFNSF